MNSDSLGPMNSFEALEMPFLAKVEEDLFDLAYDYLEKRKQDLAIMNQLIQSQQFQSVEYMAHKIKGNAGLFGLDVLAAEAGLLERFSKEKSPRQMEEVSQRMMVLLKRVKFEVV